jgi:hypothetical protein
MWQRQSQHRKKKGPGQGRREVTGVSIKVVYHDFVTVM